jgi:Dihydroorotate dehydrogenase
MPISAIGGIASWRDAAEFMALSAGTVQVCTAAMHYGFKIVDDMKDGLANWMDSQGYAGIEDFRGKAVPNVTDWQYLNHELQDHRPDRPGSLHQMRPLPYRV